MKGTPVYPVTIGQVRPSVRVLRSPGRECESIATIESLAFHGRDPWPESKLRQHIRSSRTVTAVAESAGRVLGYVNYRVDAASTTILRIAVDPNCQRMGVGSTLINHLIVRSRPEGIFTPQVARSLIATINERAADTCSFLAAAGFKATLVRAKHAGQDDSYRMELTHAFG